MPLCGGRKTLGDILDRMVPLSPWLPFESGHVDRSRKGSVTKR